MKDMRLEFCQDDGMSEQPDRIEMGGKEIPEVLRTLGGVLPQFEGADLEAQLQTYDIFLELLDPCVRPKLASLLKEAAAKTPNAIARQRIEAAAESMANGGRAAELYDHAKAMEDYQKTFRESFPKGPQPEPVVPDEPHVETQETPVVPMAHEKQPHPLLLAKLDEIEAEMKRIGYWSENPPADFVARVERGELKSYLDAPTFELWLQVLLLPRARKAALKDELPTSSMVGEMARRQYDYMSVDDKAETLLRLLQEFDALVVN